MLMLVSFKCMPAPLPDTWQKPEEEMENSLNMFIRNRIVQLVFFSLSLGVVVIFL